MKVASRLLVYMISATFFWMPLLQSAAEKDHQTQFSQAWEAGELHEAWFAAEQWSDAVHDDGEMRLAKARVFLALDAPVAALDELRHVELTRAQGETAEPLYLLKARALDEMGELEGAWHAYWQAWKSAQVAAEDMDQTAWSALESTLAEGLWPQMLIEARSILGDSPRHQGAKIIEFEVLEDMERTDEIRELLADAIEGGWKDPYIVDWDFYMKAKAGMKSPHLDYKGRIDLLDRYTGQLREETADLKHYPRFIRFIKKPPFDGYFDDETIERPKTSIEQAEELFPREDPESRFLKSNFLLLSGFSDSAFWSQRAEAAKASGRPHAAIHAVAAALSLGDSLSPAWKARQIPYLRKQLRKADQLARQAEAAWQGGDAETAMAASAQALELQPAHPRALAVKHNLALEIGNLSMAHRSLREFWRIYADEIGIPLQKAINLAASVGDWPLVFSLTEQVRVAEGELTQAILKHRNRAAFALGFDYFIEKPQTGMSDPALEKAKLVSTLLERFPGRNVPSLPMVTAVEEGAERWSDFREAPFLSLYGRYRMGERGEKLTAASERLMSEVALADQSDFSHFSDLVHGRINTATFIQRAEQTAFAKAIAALLDNTKRSETVSPSRSQKDQFDALWKMAGIPSLPLSMRLTAYRTASNQAMGPRLSNPRKTTPIYVHPEEISSSADLSGGRRIMTTHFRYDDLPANQSIRITGCKRNLNSHDSTFVMKSRLMGTATDPRFFQLENFNLKLGDIREGLKVEEGQFFGVRNAQAGDFNVVAQGSLAVENSNVTEPKINALDGRVVLRETVLGEADDHPTLLIIRDGAVHAVSVEVEDSDPGAVKVLSSNGDLNAISLRLENEDSLVITDRNHHIETTGVEHRNRGVSQSRRSAADFDAPKLDPPREKATLEIGEYPSPPSPSATRRLNAAIAGAKPGTRILLSDNAYSAHSAIRLPPGVHLYGTGGYVDRTKIWGRGSARHIIAIRGSSDHVTKLELVELGFAGNPKDGSAILVDGTQAIIEQVYPSNKSWRLWLSGKYPFLKVVNGGTVVLRSTTIWGPIIADESSTVVLDWVSGDPMILRGGGTFIVEEKIELEGRVTVADAGTRYQGPPGLVRYAEGAGNHEAILSLKKKRNANWAKAKQALHGAVKSAPDADARAKAAGSFARAVIEANQRAMQTPREALYYIADAISPLLTQYEQDAHLIFFSAGDELGSGHANQMPGLLKRLEGIDPDTYHSIISYQTANFWLPFRKMTDDSYIEDTYHLLLAFPERGAGFRWARQMRREGVPTAEARSKAEAERRSAEYWSPEQVAKREREAETRENANTRGKNQVITLAQSKRFYEVAVERGHTDFQRTLAFQLGGDYLIDWAHRHCGNTSDPYAPTIEELEDLIKLTSGETRRDIYAAIQSRKAQRGRRLDAQLGASRTDSWDQFKQNAAAQREASAIKQRRRDLKRGIFRSRRSYGLDEW